MSKKQKTVTVNCKKSHIARTEYARFSTPAGTPLYQENERGRDGDNRKFGARLVVCYMGDNGYEYRTSVWADKYTPMQQMFDSAPATMKREVQV